jgi:hypothetical protein
MSKKKEGGVWELAKNMNFFFLKRRNICINVINNEWGIKMI